MTLGAGRHVPLHREGCCGASPPRTGSRLRHWGLLQLPFNRGQRPEVMGEALLNQVNVYVPQQLPKSAIM